jgi:alcohol dehydrogenase class IV
LFTNLNRKEKNMVDTINIRIPNTLIGLGAISNIGDIAKSFSPSKILIVTDAGVIKSGVVDAVKSPLEKVGYKFDVFDGCVSDPPISSVEKLCKKVKAAHYDLLIGIGGGSTMDATKIASQIAANDGINTYDLLNGKVVEKAISKILVPTTAGTGSEWSSVAMVSDDNADMQKKGVISIKNLPDAVIIDPELMRSLPQIVTRDTGMDALAHAIEAYTSCNANVISDMFATTAIKLIWDNLPIAYSKGSKNIEARYHLSIAASFAMYAACISGVGIGHFMGEPVQNRVHLSHGQACALMLPYAMDFHLIANQAKFAKIAEIMGEVISSISILDAAAKSVEAVRRLSKTMGMPQTLSDVGIKEADIPEMVKEMHAEKDFLIRLWNPRDVSPEDTTRIYKIALRGRG